MTGPDRIPHSVGLYPGSEPGVYARDAKTKVLMSAHRMKLGRVGDGIMSVLLHSLCPYARDLLIQISQAVHLYLLQFQFRLLLQAQFRIQ